MLGVAARSPRHKRSWPAAVHADALSSVAIGLSSEHCKRRKTEAADFVHNFDALCTHELRSQTEPAGAQSSLAAVQQHVAAAPDAQPAPDARSRGHRRSTPRRWDELEQIKAFLSNERLSTLRNGAIRDAMDIS